MALQLSVVMFASLAAQLSTGAAEVDQAGAEARLQSVVDELNDLDSWLSDAERRRLRWLKELQAKDRAVAKLNATVRASAASLADVRARVEALRAKRTQLDAKRAEQARHLAAHLATAYRITGRQFIKLLFRQESVASAERMMVYQQFIAQARTRTIESARRLAVEAERGVQDLQRQREAERGKLALLQTQREQLAGELETRQVLLDSLNQEFEDRENRRRRLLNDRQRLQKLITQFEQLLSGGDFAARKGQLPWPLEGELTSQFGQPRADGGMKWEGLFLSAPAGSPVVAVHGGRVAFADWFRGFGYLTIIDHGGGYMTLYGHTDQVTRKADALVAPGEVIAHAGQSGGAPFIGVYFELRAKGQPEDPLPWLAD